MISKIVIIYPRHRHIDTLLNHRRRILGRQSSKFTHLTVKLLISNFIIYNFNGSVKIKT